MTSALVLVRHAPPVPDSALPRGEWSLSEEGRSAAAKLGASLAANDRRYRIVASDERKAIETGVVLGGAFGDRRRPSVDARFGEVEHPWIDQRRRERVIEYLEGAEHEGWETTDAVAARMRAGIDDLRSTLTPIVVTHGMAMSLLVASVCADVVASEFWSDLQMPDAWWLDLRTGAHERTV